MSLDTYKPDGDREGRGGLVCLDTFRVGVSVSACAMTSILSFRVALVSGCVYMVLWTSTALYPASTLTALGKSTVVYPISITRKVLIPVHRQAGSASGGRGYVLCRLMLQPVQ